MVEFRSKYDTYDLIIGRGEARTVIDGRTGKEVVYRDPVKTLHFRNGSFKTDDPKTLEILRNDPRFKKDYWEIPPPPTKKEIYEQKKKELKELESQLDKEKEISEEDAWEEQGEIGKDKKAKIKKPEKKEKEYVRSKSYGKRKGKTKSGGK